MFKSAQYDQWKSISIIFCGTPQKTWQKSTMSLTSDRKKPRKYKWNHIITNEARTISIIKSLFRGISIFYEHNSISFLEASRQRTCLASAVCLLSGIKVSQVPRPHQWPSRVCSNQHAAGTRARYTRIHSHTTFHKAANVGFYVTTHHSFWHTLQMLVSPSFLPRLSSSLSTLQ